MSMKTAVGRGTSQEDSAKRGFSSSAGLAQGECLGETHLLWRPHTFAQYLTADRL